jgi:hypothetical protein
VVWQGRGVGVRVHGGQHELVRHCLLCNCAMLAWVPAAARTLAGRLVEAGCLSGHSHRQCTSHRRAKVMRGRAHL